MRDTADRGPYQTPPTKAPTKTATGGKPPAKPPAKAPDSKHPHMPAGSPKGGQFAPKGSGGGGSRGGGGSHPRPHAAAKTAPKPTGKTLPRLKRGMNNDPARVKELQALVARLGQANLAVDGVFGPRTEAAIKAIQQRLGLKPNGIASNALVEKMKVAEALSPCIKRVAASAQTFSVTLARPSPAEMKSSLIAAAADRGLPYGDVTYADPGYQADKKKRYPLMDAAHCRNAWSRINDPDNAAKYTPSQLKRIKSRIKAAGERYGINFAEDVQAAAGSFAGVELGRPGTWLTKNGPREFTAQDFKDAADFFEATGRQRIPIGPGHSDPRFDGDPAFGWVENMRYAEDAEGPVLLGDLVDMDDWVAAAAPRRWPKRSIEGWANFEWKGRTYSLVLNRLALLGNTPPAMPTLRSLSDLREAIAAAAADSGAELIAASALD